MALTRLVGAKLERLGCEWNFKLHPYRVSSSLTSWRPESGSRGPTGLLLQRLFAFQRRASGRRFTAAMWCRCRQRQGLRFTSRRQVRSLCARVSAGSLSQRVSKDLFLSPSPRRAHSVGLARTLSPLHTFRWRHRGGQGPKKETSRIAGAGRVSL